MRSLILPPAAFLMSAALMVVLHLSMPIVHLVPQPANWLGLTLVATGLAISYWHTALFQRVGTNVDTFLEPGTLTTEGLFSRTRNPMYLGMLTALLGVEIVLGSLSPLVALFGFFGLAQLWYIPFEERAMARKFGDQYAEYRRAVRRWL
jgi:protein-S-isoprenylcysteine O-methyltransferase Ste14